ANLCGHCDNCLNKEETESDLFSKEEAEKVLNHLKNNESSIIELQAALEIKKSVIQTVIQFLIREEKISVVPSSPGKYKATFQG
ncbi:MAG: RecQ family ATP-dependent DNA helicase, partial [Gracilimonas sp.]|nr:RecQ family ATP-dependent DNA helicase [Gracilimonas sp.]